MILSGIRKSRKKHRLHKGRSPCVQILHLLPVFSHNMISANQIKHIRSLAVKKYRQQHKQFLIEGDKMVLELLSQDYIQTVSVYALERWVKQNAHRLSGLSDILNQVTEAELHKISAMQSPNQVLAVAEIPEDQHLQDYPGQDLCLYLDGIQDPGNLGSILRVADWFGIPAVFCSPDTVDAFSPKVVQASMGALYRVKTAEINLNDLISQHPGIPVLGAVLDGQNIFEVKNTTSGLLVIGNEGRGVSESTMLQINQRVTIPRHPDGGAESLNAAIATGILVAALRRS